MSQTDTSKIKLVYYNTAIYYSVQTVLDSISNLNNFDNK